MLAGRWLVSLRVGATLLLTNEETMLCYLPEQGPTREERKEMSSHVAG